MTDFGGASHDIHGRPSHQTDGFAEAWPRPAVRGPGDEAHRHSFFFRLL